MGPSVWLVQRNSSVGTRKDLLHRPDGVGIHDNHPWLSRLHRPQKGLAKFTRGAYACRLETERTGDSGKVRTLEIDADASSVEVRVLDISQNAVASVIKQYDHKRGVLLTRSRELADVHQQAAVAAKSHYGLLWRGNLGADRHGQSLADAAAGSVERRSRVAANDQTAAPCGGRHGDIPDENGVVGERFENR